jgi:hypothetical protein
MNKITIRIRILFAVSLFQHLDHCHNVLEGIHLIPFTSKSISLFVERFTMIQLTFDHHSPKSMIDLHIHMWSICFLREANQIICVGQWVHMLSLC